MQWWVIYPNLVILHNFTSAVTTMFTFEQKDLGGWGYLYSVESSRVWKCTYIYSHTTWKFSAIFLLFRINTYKCVLRFEWKHQLKNYYEKAILVWRYIKLLYFIGEVRQCGSFVKNINTFNRINFTWLPWILLATWKKLFFHISRSALG